MDKSPSAAPVPKVLSATAGSGFGGAVGAIIVWGLQQAGYNVPSEIGIAIATVCGIVVTFLAGYFTPPGGAR